MTFRESFFAVKDLVEERLHDYGISSANADEMTWVAMLNTNLNTRVTIDVPLTLVYSDAFNITGTLETSTYRRLSNKTVKLIGYESESDQSLGESPSQETGTVLATTTTDNNGEYSFTQTPSTMEPYSYKVVFEGTAVYNASESSMVYREIGKETSVINLNATARQHIGDSVVIGGQLLDNDGQYISEATVEITYSGNQSSELENLATTDAQGRFSKTITMPDVDSLDYEVIYDGSSNYTACVAYGQVLLYETVTFPTLNDVYQFIPITLNYTFDTDCETAPITLFVDGVSHSTSEVNSNGEVSFDISNLADGSYTAQLKILTNDIFETGQSSTFDLIIGTDVYINPSLTLTSDKNILSYADSETATITAHLGANPSSIKDIPIVFSTLEYENTITSFSSENVNEDLGDDYYLELPSSYNGDIILTKSGDLGSVAITNTNSGSAIMIAKNIEGDIIEQTVLVNGKLEMEVIDGSKILVYNYFGDDANTVATFTENKHGTLITLDENSFDLSNLYTIEATASEFNLKVYKVLGIDETDEYGDATCSYNSAGVGDVIVRAHVRGRTFLIQTFVIEDCERYVATEYSLITSNNNYVGINPYSGVVFDSTKDWLIEFDVKLSGGGRKIGLLRNDQNVSNANQYDFAIGFTNIYNAKQNNITDNTGERAYNFTWNALNYYHIVITKIGGAITIDVGDEDSITINPSYLANKGFVFQLSSWVSGSSYIKNLKIKKS